MIDGLIVIDKPKGFTSRDVVNKVSKILKTKKIGHTGTLDPIACGVLVLTVGKATKLTDILTSNDKEYIAEMVFGIETDTLDIEGKIINEENIFIKRDTIENTLQLFVGSYEQEVPIYSAVKVNGKKLYEYARNGEEVILPKKIVTIYKIDLIDYKIENKKIKVSFSCLVSKGTYIRGLIRDISKKLNTYGIMTNLRRVKQGKYDIENSYSIEDIENGNYKIIKFEEIFKNYKHIIMDEELEKKIVNGVKIKDIYNEGYIIFKSKEGIIKALYKKDDIYLKPYKMFL